MDDEIQIFAEGRPAAPPYSQEAKQEARRRLVHEARSGRRFRFPRFGWQVAGAFGLTVVLVGGVSVALSSGQGGQGNVGSSAVVSTEPQLTFPELSPRAGQFLLIESETMYTSEGQGEDGAQSRYLYRTARYFYRSVDGSAPGLLRIEGRSPQQWPGWTIPKEAESWQGSEWMEIDGHCPGTPDASRTDYAYLSTLPADAAGMRDYLYQRAGDKVSPDESAFTAFGDLVRETYMPLAQRKALIEAAKTIPGTQVAEGVEDSAGRKGTAIGRMNTLGQLVQQIFDQESATFLGERATVVEEKAAQAPAGTVLALTAQLKVSVVDALPQAEGVTSDSSCEMATQQPEVKPTQTITPTPIPSDEASVPTSMPTSIPTEEASEVTITSTFQGDATPTPTR